MSSFQDTQAEDQKKNDRRRPNGGGRKRPVGERAEGAAERTERPKVDRPPAVPFPAELMDKTSTGIVNATVRRGRVKFGFINLGNDEKANDVPRIYFSFENVPDTDVILRRGYPVTFTAKTDDKGRTHAVDVKLTEAGKPIAAEREAYVAQKKADRAAANAAAAAAAAAKPKAAKAPKEARAPREKRETAPRAPRPPREDRPMTIKVTCEGHKEAKNVEVNLAQSVGRLKAVAMAAFEGCPATYNVYHIGPDGSEVYLTRSLLNKLTSNDTVHLGEPKEKA
jgi:hypothetical protein